MPVINREHFTEFWLRRNARAATPVIVNTPDGRKVPGRILRVSRSCIRVATTPNDRTGLAFSFSGQPYRGGVDESRNAFITPPDFI